MWPVSAAYSCPSMQDNTATKCVHMLMLLGLLLVACRAPWGDREGCTGHVTAEAAPLDRHALFRGASDSNAQASSGNAQVSLFVRLLCSA